MIINGVEMQYQLNEFANEIMTSPPWQKYHHGKLKRGLDPDYIFEYGCLLTAKLNCYNLFHKDYEYMNLKQLNNKMIDQKGYFFLYLLEKYAGDLIKTKDACFGKESFSIRETLNGILGIIHEKEIWKDQIDILSKNKYYIIRTPYQGTGHYSMIIDSHCSYIDSYSGKIELPKEILNIYEITF